MSDFFLHENILIKYWIDQCSKYELHGNKIKSAIANIPLSITPDIKENVFEDGSKQPCEIKYSRSHSTPHTGWLGHGAFEVLKYNGLGCQRKSTEQFQRVQSKD